MALNPLTVRLIPYALLGAALIGGYIYVLVLKTTIQSQEATINAARYEIAGLQLKIDEITRDKQALTDNLEKANSERKKVREELNRTLTKMRAQKPPSDCKEAIDWSVKNKGDLNW